MADKGNFWGTSGALGIGSSLLGMIGGHNAQKRQHRNTKELMGMQHKNQRNLNQMGHDLQMDMWNKTNYRAQVDHMLEAGLNPALMYGSAGQGGQTGSQGGGSAAMGQAQQMKMLDMSAMKMGAEIEAIREGVERSKWERGEKGTAEINDLAAATALKRSGIELNESQINQINENIEKIKADTDLTKTIKEKDYGGQFGKNVTQNIMDILTGKAGLDLWDMAGIAAGIGALSWLRNGKQVGKAASAGMAKTMDVLRKRLNKLKKKDRPTNEFDYKKLQRNLDAETIRRRSMDIGNQ